MRSDDRRRFVAVLRELANTLEAGASQWFRPVSDEYPVSQPWGYDSTYPYNGGWHKGIDYATPEGTPCWFREDGIVVRAGFDMPWDGPYENDGAANGTWGGYVEIVSDEYPDVFWGLAHLSQINVAVGDHVVGGQVVGLTGSTGTTTGPHVHEQKWLGDVRVDPDS